LGAISVKKVVTSVNLLGSIDGITFEAFIIRKLVPQLWKGACVVMDNYGIHKGEEIEKAIKKAGARLIFLPPYSPDFSPIENFWSQVKGILRTLGARTYKALSSAITRVLSKLTSKTSGIGLLTAVIVPHLPEKSYN
jgi:transposase